MHTHYSAVRLIVLIAFLLSALGGPAPVSAGTDLSQAAGLQSQTNSPAGPAVPAQSSQGGPFPVYLPLVLTPPSYITVTIPASGGSVSFHAGQIQVSFPANAANGAITLKVLLPSVQAPNGMYAIGQALQVEAYDASGSLITQFNKAVTLTFSYAALDFLVWPDFHLMTQTASGWTDAGTTYVSGQKAVQAKVTHFSTYALFSLGTNSYNLLTGDASGSVYYADTRNVIYRLAAGSSQSEVYADLSAVIGTGGVYGGLACDPATGTLYLATAPTVYRITTGKQVTSLFTIPFSNQGNYINSLHFSPSFNTLFVSSHYNAYQVDASSGALLQTLNAGKLGIATSSNKAIFALEDYVDFEPHAAYSMLVIWPDVNNQSSMLKLQGFWGASHLAVDAADNIYIPNKTGNAISVVGGPDLVVTGAIRGITAPTNVAVAGDTLVVATQGGLQAVPRSRRDPSPYSPAFLNQPTLSGQGSAVVIYNGDPVPAHNTLRVNGQVQRHIWSASDQLHLVSYSLSTTVAAFSGPKLTSYNQLTYQVQVTLAGDPPLTATLAMPEPGNVENADIYTEITLGRGEWGVFESDLVVSQEKLFSDWSPSPTHGDRLFYQFNRIGDFHFTENTSSPRSITVHVTTQGEPVDLGFCHSQGGGQINPAFGAIYRDAGTTLEIPAGALPGASPYTLTVQKCNKSFPGKDAVTSAGYDYEYTLSPQPVELEQPIVSRSPYDPAQSPAPVGAFYDPVLDDLVQLPYILANGQVVITLPSGDYTSGIPTGASAAAVPARLDQANAASRLATILGGIWWAVGLPDSFVYSSHFLVYFNTRDCSLAYAQKLLADLDFAYDQLLSEGFSMPVYPVLVKVAPWISASTRPGATIGTDGVYHLFFNNLLSSADVDITTAHEVMHLSQHESIGVVNFPLTSNWWLEGTATWSEYHLYPGNQGYLANITNSMNFPNTPFSSWGSLSTEQQYATMALAQYMVNQKGVTVIEKVNQDRSHNMPLRDALQDAVGENWLTFYGKWAREYWMQTYDPVKNWSMDPVAMQTVIPISSVTPVVNESTLSSLTSGVVRAYYDSSKPNLPVSFTTGIDSVIRAAASCADSDVVAYDKKKNVQESFVGAVDPADGQPLRRISTYISSDAMYFVYINSGASVCNLQVVWEAPTLTNMSSTSIPKNTPTQITLTGSGFGPKTGSVFAGGSTYTPTAWSDSSVTFTLPGRGQAGSVTVQVETPTGALSNPMTITIY